VIGMVNERQTLCPDRRQRRHTIERAQAVLAQAEDLLLAALVFVVFLYPLLFDPTLLFNLSAWLWWVKGFAWIGLLAWAAIRLLVGLPLAPAQLTGATVEAMEQAAPEKELVSFAAAQAEECLLLPWRLPPASIEQAADNQAKCYRQQLWRRPCRRRLFDFPIRRSLPPSSLSPEPSA
jgi:hypothetical protein